MLDPDSLHRLDRRLAAIEAAICAPPRLALSMPETCKALGVSEPTVRALMAAGRLSSTRTGPDGKSGSHLFAVRDVERFLAARDGMEGGAQ